MADSSQSSTVQNNLPSTPNNNGGESLGVECNTTVDEESATPVTKNSSSAVRSLSSSAVWSLPDFLVFQWSVLEEWIFHCSSSD